MYFSGLLTAAEAIFILADAALIVFFVWVLAHALEIRPPIAPRPPQGIAFSARRAEIQQAWQSILQTYSKGTPDNLKIAIINADKLVDTMLKDAGFAGDHMVDRLKQIPAARLGSLERLYRAHRVRNNIVHTPDFAVNPSLARQTIEDYESFLKELRYID
jgi:hypothetical protein